MQECCLRRTRKLRIGSRLMNRGVLLSWDTARDCLLPDIRVTDRRVLWEIVAESHGQ